MKIIDITIIYLNSTAANAYLALLKKNDYLPKTIIEIKVELQHGRKFKLLQKLIGTKITTELFYLKNKSLRPKNMTHLAKLIMTGLPLNPKELKINPKKLCQKYLKIEIKDLEDNKLYTLLSQVQNPTFLFTGGGILKEKILSIPNSKFIHVHPGIVPEVKGADGLFWSILTRNKPGYSCFYMNEGIDTGKIIYQEEFDIPNFSPSLLSYNTDEIYRGLLDYYDPVLRAITLINMIKKSEKNNYNLNRLPFAEQNPESGRTFFFMHFLLRKRIIDLIVNKTHNDL